MSASQKPIMFGLLLEDVDADERALMLGRCRARPWLLLTVGAWQFQRYVKRLRGA